MEFKKKLHNEATELAKETKHVDFLNFEDKEDERNKLQKLKTLECIKYNHATTAIKKKEQLKIKEEEKQCAIQANELMQEIITNEQKVMEQLKNMKKLAFKDHEAEKIVVERVKAQEEKLNDDLNQAYNNSQEKKNCRMEQVLKQIYQGRSETKQSKDLYKMTEHLQDEKNKQLEHFVDCAIHECEERNIKKDKDDINEEKERRLCRCIISQMNKLTGEEIKFANSASCANKKCVCDRQTILPNTNPKTSKKIESCDKSDNREMPNSTQHTFMKTHSKLVEELKQREKEPSPWNGTQTAHAQFALNAAAALKEYEHTPLVYKVINEYRRCNCLDDKTLPIPNN